MTSFRIVALAPLAFFTLMGSGCADEPITADQLQADGQLRASSLEQSAFSAQERTTTRRAAQISAVLAAQAEGPLADSNRFDADVGEVHLTSAPTASTATAPWCSAGRTVAAPPPLKVD